MQFQLTDQGASGKAEHPRVPQETAALKVFLRGSLIGLFDKAQHSTATALIESITGFELMEKGAQPWSVDKVAQATGLSEDAVTAFYRTLAESPRTIIWMGGCLSRYTNGLQSIRAIIALQALRDNLIGSGRGLLTMEGGKPEGEKEFVDAQGQRHNWRNELAEKLIVLQNPDGSWVNRDSKDWWEDKPELVTSWSVQALEHAMK